MIISHLLVISVFVLFTLSEDLYGLERGGFNISFAKIDTQTAVHTQIGKTNVDYIPTFLATMDSQNEIFFTQSFNRNDGYVYILGIDIEDGSLKYEIKTPFIEYDFPQDALGQTIQYDPVSGDLFVVGLTEKPSPRNYTHRHHIYRLTPQTGHFEHLGEIDAMDCIEEASSYDHISGHLVLQFELYDSKHIRSLYVFVFDVHEKKVVNTFENTEKMNFFKFDSDTNLFYGIGVRQKLVHNRTMNNRTILSMDLKGNFNVIRETIGYFWMLSTVSAYNQKEKLMYAILQPKREEEVDDTVDYSFYILTIDVRDGEIKNAAACREFDELDPYALSDGEQYCPVSLARLSK